MKTKCLNKILLLFLAGIMCAACYDDKSKLATDSIDGLSIEWSGNDNLYVGYLEQLDVVPQIYRGSTLNPDGLVYKWEISDLANSNCEDFTELSSEAELHAVIRNEIATNSYYLRLTVTDTLNNDLQAVYLWNVYVQSSFLDGLVVSDTQDNTTSDLSLIQHPQLTLNYNKDPYTFYHILEGATGTAYPQLMNSLTYAASGYLVFSHTSQLWAITDQGDCARFNTNDFSQNGSSDDESMLVYKPESMKFYDLFSAGSVFFAYTSNGWYDFNVASANVLAWPDANMASYSLDNHCVARTGDWSKSYSLAVWFDAETGEFVSYEGWNVYPQYRTFNSNSYFDPQNMKGYTAVAAGMTSNSYVPTFLMKEKAAGSYAIYTFTVYVDADGYYDDDWNWYETSSEVPASANMKYEIPAEGKALLDKAVSVAFTPNASIMYVATADGIYAIDFSGSRAVVYTTAKYTPSSGETITKMKMYTQGAYVFEQNVVGAEGSIEELALNTKALIVVTQKGEYEGKVSVVPMVQLGTGNLDATNALTFDGFGKILDVTTTAY